MSRTRRYICSNRPYELILRVKEGLPFAPLAVINLLLLSALARAQRDIKVTICHVVWMSNHVHIILVAHDPTQCIYFIQEVQKKITDYLKRLLGRRRLSLWEGDPVLAQILDVERAVEKIAYIYANPASADLVDSIADYPGISTWSHFSTAPSQTKFSCSETVPWIRLPAIDQLPSPALSSRQDRHIANKLKSTAKIEHQLTYHPNAWLEALRVRDEASVAAINQRIKLRLREIEDEARERRRVTNKKVLGAERLMRQPILKAHLPKQRGRRIYVITSSRTLRLKFILTMRWIKDRCRECYQRWKLGDFSVQWPPGTFRPGLAPAASLIA